MSRRDFWAPGLGFVLFAMASFVGMRAADAQGAFAAPGAGGTAPASAGGTKATASSAGTAGGPSGPATGHEAVDGAGYCETRYAGKNLQVIRLGDLSIDPSSNSGSTVIEVRNAGKEKLSVSLYAREFRTGPRSSRLDAKAVIGAPNDKGTETYRLDLDPDQRRELRVTASGTWDAGFATAPLCIDNQMLVELRAKLSRVPFNVKPSTPGTTTTPVVARFDENQAELAFRVENSDALNYPVIYRLELDGHEITPPLGSLVPASGSSELKVDVPSELFPDCASALAKQRVLSGVLKIALDDTYEAPTAAPPRTFPVVVALERRPEWVRAFWSGALAFFLLTLGGVVSLYLNHGIPNAFRRFGIDRKLDPLAARTKRLSNFIHPQIRIDLRVRRLELSQRARSERIFYPAANEVLEGVATDVDMLEKRVDLASRIDDRIQVVRRMGADGPPELLGALLRRLRHLTRALLPVAPGEQAFQSVEDGLKATDAEIAKIETDDVTLRSAHIEKGNALCKSVGQKWDKLFPAGADESTWPRWAKALHDAMGAFVTHARICFATADDEHQEESLASLDTAVAKLSIIATYIRVCECASAEQNARFDLPDAEYQKDDATVPTQRQIFFDCLSGSSMQALEQARHLIRAAEQGIFVRELVEQIEGRKYRIEVSPQSVAPYELTSFRVVFLEPKFNDAAARDRLECVWTFLHGAHARTETSWATSQFFTQLKKNPVSVSFCRGPYRFSPKPLPKDVPDPLQKVDIEVRPLSRKEMRHRTKLEVVQLAVTIVITMVALLSGAQEQLNKLDTFAGIAAVFAIGFGADIVKNLIARRTPGNGGASTST